MTMSPDGVSRSSRVSSCGRQRGRDRVLVMTTLPFAVVCAWWSGHLRRADRAPGRCRAGGGLLGGKDPPATRSVGRSIVVQDRAYAAVLGEQGIAAQAEQIQVEGLVSLSLGVTLDLDRDGLTRLARRESQRAGPGDVVGVAGRGGAVHSLERYGYRLVIR